MINPAFEPSDVYYDLDDLALLIESIKDAMHEMSFTHPDGTRNAKLDQVYAMVKVAEREARRQCEQAAIFDRAGEWVPRHREVK